MPLRRRKRAGRIVLFGLGGIVFVALLALLAAVTLFDPNVYRPEIAAAVKRATGRDFTIAGPIGLTFGLTPVLTINDAALANTPSGSQTEMASVRRAEAEIALLPLLSRQVVMTRLVLIQPKLLLERDATGQPNWAFSPPPRPEAAGAATARDATQAPRSVSVGEVLVRDGEIRWRANQRAAVTTVTVGRLEARIGTGDAPMAARADLVVNGIAAAADLATGPLARLRAPSPGSSWPIRATVTGSAGRIAVSGTMDRPAEFGGYTLAIEGASTDLALLRPVLPIALPPLHDATMSASVREVGGVPVWSQLKLHAGRSNLETLMARAMLERLEASADSLSQPLRIDAGGSLRDVSLSASGTLPSPAALAGAVDGGRAAFDVIGTVGAGHVTAKGEIGSLAALTDVAMTLTARLPDLADVTRLTGAALPGFRDIAFDGTLSDADGGLSRAAKLSGATLSTAQGDVSGDATVRFSKKPSVSARLVSRRIDVDALVTALDPPAAAKLAPEPPAASPSASVAPAQPAPAATTVEAPPRPPLPKLILPSRQIHLDFLQDVDLDIDENAAVVHAFGTDYRDVAGHLVVSGAKLTLDPFTGQTPGGALSGRLGIDASAPDHPLVLGLHAPTVALKPLLAAFGLPDAVDGNVEVDVDLRGSSRSPHDLAASANGRLALVMVDGDVDNALLARLAGDIVHTARPADMAGSSGRTRLRCLATRIDLSNGTASINTFVLDSSRLLLVGSGTATMGDEALALRLRPLLRMGGPGITVPVRIGGMLGAPKIALDTASLADGLLGGRAATAAASSVLVDQRGDPCPAALASARDGRPGPAPAEAPALLPTPSGKAPNAAQLLRGLVR